jgi:hypothetical protein
MFWPTLDLCRRLPNITEPESWPQLYRALADLVEGLGEKERRLLRGVRTPDGIRRRMKDGYFAVTGEPLDGDFQSVWPVLLALRR